MKKSSKTERAIKDAFLFFLTSKHYEKITVKEIVEYSDIGRTTFYTHFQDITDVLESIENKLLEILTIYRKGDIHEISPFDGMVRWFESCIDHRHVLLTLTSQNGDPYFIQRFRNKIRRELYDMMNDECVPADSLRNYFIEMLASAYIGLVMYAVSLEDDERLSARELAIIINHTRAAYFKGDMNPPLISDEQLFGRE